MRGESGSPRGVPVENLASPTNTPSPSSGPEGIADPSGPTGWRAKRATAGRMEGTAKRRSNDRRSCSYTPGSFIFSFPGCAVPTRGGPSGSASPAWCGCRRRRVFGPHHRVVTLGPGSDRAPRRDPPLDHPRRGPPDAWAVFQLSQRASSEVPGAVPPGVVRSLARSQPRSLLALALDPSPAIGPFAMPRSEGHSRLPAIGSRRAAPADHLRMYKGETSPGSVAIRGEEKSGSPWWRPEALARSCHGARRFNGRRISSKAVVP